MANLKRPAVSTNKGRSKRPRIAARDSKGASSPDEQSDVEVTGISGEDPGSTVPGPSTDDSFNVEVKLKQIRSIKDQRRKETSEFNVHVRQKQKEMSDGIEKAKEQIQARKNDFQQSVMPLLVSLLEPVNRSDKEEGQIGLPMVIGPIDSTKAFTKAQEVLKNCATLLASYETVRETPKETIDTGSFRDDFGKDKQAIMNAFDAGKKLVINQLQMKLAERMDEIQERYAMTEEELHLAKMLLGKTKRQGGSTEKDTGPSLGLLLHECAKRVAKLQTIVD